MYSWLSFLPFIFPHSFSSFLVLFLGARRMIRTMLTHLKTYHTPMPDMRGFGPSAFVTRSHCEHFRLPTPTHFIFQLFSRLRTSIPPLSLSPSPPTKSINNCRYFYSLQTLHCNSRMWHSITRSICLQENFGESLLRTYRFQPKLPSIASCSGSKQEHSEWSRVFPRVLIRPHNKPVDNTVYTFNQYHTRLISNTCSYNHETASILICNLTKNPTSLPYYFKAILLIYWQVTLVISHWCSSLTVSLTLTIDMALFKLL